jgi:hypothetical protein
VSESLKQEFVSSYLDENGLGKFQDEDRSQSVAARSDNPILITAIGFSQYEIEDSDRSLIKKAIKVLTVTPGLYKRRPDADLVLEAHDNMVAIASLDSDAAKDICDYGNRMGWQFANVDNSKYSPTQLVQGGDIAYFKIRAGYLPYPLELLWLCGGLIYAFLFGNPSTWNLARLKLQTMYESLKDKGGLWLSVELAFIVTGLSCLIISQVKKIYPKQYLNYFGPDHVITRKAMQ